MILERIPEMIKVETLKKITLSFQAGTSSDTMDLAPKYPEYEFIFGIAPEGMTPFEYELVDKSEGEEVLLHLKKDSFYRFFEHQQPPIMDLFDGAEDVYLKVKIVNIAAPENREIVKAMADMAAQGNGVCDCGCGCGG